MSDNASRLSMHQYGTLKYIRNHRVTLGYLRKAHATTLGSLAQRELICKTSSGDEAEVILTPAGEEAFKCYHNASLNERSHEGNLTDRCMRLLQHARRIAVIGKSA